MIVYKLWQTDEWPKSDSLPIFLEAEGGLLPRIDLLLTWVGLIKV